MTTEQVEKLLQIIEEDKHTECFGNMECDGCPYCIKTADDEYCSEPDIEEKITKYLKDIGAFK